MTLDEIRGGLADMEGGGPLHSWSWLLTALRLALAEVDRLQKEWDRHERERSKILDEVIPANMNGDSDLPGEMRLMRQRAEKAEAEADVRSGRWCEQNRAEGRGGCGMCAWCCKESQARAEKAEAKVERLAALLRRIRDWDLPQVIDAALAGKDGG